MDFMTFILHVRFQWLPVNKDDAAWTYSVRVIKSTLSAFNTHVDTPNNTFVFREVLMFTYCTDRCHQNYRIVHTPPPPREVSRVLLIPFYVKDADKVNVTGLPYEQFKLYFNVTVADRCWGNRTGEWVKLLDLMSNEILNNGQKVTLRFLKVTG